MGRWAQASRGGRGHLLSNLPLPTAPALQQEGEEVRIETTTSGNSGGRVRMFGGDSPAGPWTQVNEVAWGGTVLEPIETWSGWTYANALEIGGGVSYAGESPLGIPLELEAG